MEIPRTISGPSNGKQVSTEIPPETHQGGGRLPSSIAGIREKRRGVQPGTKRGPYDKGKSAAQPAAPGAAPVPPPVPMFTEANTRILIRLPFELAFNRTGWTGFHLTQMEEETLVATGVNVFNQWVTVDPKYVSLTLFSISLLTIAGEKYFSYRSALEQYHKEKDKPAADARTPLPAEPPKEVIQP